MKTEVNSFLVGEGMLSLTKKKLSDTLSLLKLLKKRKSPFSFFLHFCPWSKYVSVPSFLIAQNSFVYYSTQCEKSDSAMPKSDISVTKDSLCISNVHLESSLILSSKSRCYKCIWL